MDCLALLKSDYWKKVFDYFETNKPSDPVCSFAFEVLENKNKYSSMVILAVARHLLFYYRWKNESDFPFYFDTSTLDKLQKFANKIIIPETSQSFIFPNFRLFIAGFILGWKYKQDPTSFITSEVFDVEARKQWKSSFWAMMALATSRGLLGDGKSEVYFCGPHKESSNIPYNIALGYLKRNKVMQNKFERFNSIRIVSRNQGLIKALPFDKAGLEGKNPSLVILTEYHLHKDDTMQESAKSSKNLSRKNQLIVYDTTKGNNINSSCYYREKDYKTFLIEQIQTPQTIHPNYGIFLFCAELDEQDIENWKNSDLWVKANPALGLSVSLQDLENEFAAITTAQAEAEFKAKRLGIWSNIGTAHFNVSQVLECLNESAPIVENWLRNHSLSELNALVGLDLSSSNDTTAIAINWELPIEGGESIYIFKVHGFIPEGQLIKKELSDRARYREWVNKGIMTISPGNVIDYSLIVNKLQEWKNEFKIDKVLYDRWEFFAVKQNLINTNIFHDSQLKEVKQGVYLNPAFQEFEIKLMRKKIHFLDFNEMLINHLLNIQIKNTSSSSETFFIKKLTNNSRIDAFIACLNTLSERHNVNSNNSDLVYDIITT
ncbi:terminase large subunit [Mycoplasmopsis bovigenitalium]|uniref:terminase TerL endonuclease subunit n=1 Tax=Mycoplasmopsis bovigenitalium TaxID=2112 RepID=UPI00090B167E|nr:terminase TerL endonuclease subunit [Mycoplasmopsis bovigenitalium]BAW18192.1 terminase large subunit [Mycoplasmopsis bovigenitalium]